MGSLFGGSKNTTTTSNSSQSSSNWLADNDTYSSLVNQAIEEGSTMDLPQYQYADYNQAYYDALNQAQQGVDLSYLTDASNNLSSFGSSQLSSGLGLQQQATDKLNSLANMTQEDYQKGYQAEYNSDLVNQQIAGLTSDVNNEYSQQVQALNQQANATGNMGNSRAGVAQGVIAGQAQKAIASGSLQYRTTEENNAFNRYQTMLSNQQSSASSLASLAGQQISTGYNAYNAGVGYQSQYNTDYMQQIQNSLSAGQQLQTIDQNKLEAERQNQLINASPALSRLGYLQNVLGQIAGYSTTGTGTNTTVVPSSSSGILGGLIGAGGAAIGGYYGGSSGATLGGSLGSSIGSNIR